MLAVVSIDMLYPDITGMSCALILRRKTAIIAFAALLFFIFCFPAMVLYAGNSKGSELSNNDHAPLKIKADELLHNRTDKAVTGTGHVEVQYKDYTVYADTITLHTETGKGTASGDVKITDRNTEADFSCEKADFNIRTKKGTLFNGEGIFKKDYFVTGRTFERLDERRFKIERGTLTTCRGEGKPAWSFSVKKAVFEIEGYAYLSNAIFLIKDVPVLYLPYIIVPVKTKRATGFLFPYAGYSGKDGFFVNNSFFYAINRWSDMTFYLDYMTRKGVRPGIEYRYTPSVNTRGEVRGNYLKESDTKKEFWKIDLEHFQTLPFDIKNITVLDLVSGNNTDKEFSDSSSLRTKRQADSYASFSKNWRNESVKLTWRYRDSVDSTVDERFSQLPQFLYKRQQERIGSSPFYFDMEAGYTFFLLDTPFEYVSIHRSDLIPSISLPITTLPYLTVTPKAGIKEVLYSRGKDKKGKLTGWFAREAADFRIDIEGPKFARIFNNSSLQPAYKHIIEPRFEYSYKPDMDKGDRERIWYRGTSSGTRGFDSIDRIGVENMLTYSITNRLLKKTTRGAEEILRLEVKNSYDLRKKADEKPFSGIRIDLDSHIIPPLTINVDGEYGIYSKRLENLNIETILKVGKAVNLEIERRYGRKQNTYVTGKVDLNLIDRWSLGYAARYDETKRAFQENDYSLSYNAACWDISFDLIDRNIFRAGKKDKELKFYILITLKGIGTFGKKRKGW